MEVTKSTTFSVVLFLKGRFVMTDYKLLSEQLRALAEDEPNFIPVLSNASALINDNMTDLNWAGFYLMDNGSLLLGPFQGKVACIRIALGKGVCGTAAQLDETQLVPNVHEFPGHIACDSASNSEIVVPIHKDGKVIGVLDIDSPSLNRFTEEDKVGLEAFVKVLEEVTVF
jgi:GAF domain-containing protein